MSKLHAYESPSFRGEIEVKIARTVLPEPEAAFAMGIIERIALAAATGDGEDTAGRQKLRLQAPAEIVQRACEISHLAFEEFGRRGWLKSIPTPTPAKAHKEEL